jgi:DNA-binding NtrC family response regulator
MKVLIIDDEKQICESIKNILFFAGIKNIKLCYDAVSGEKEINKNIYDVVLLDLMMPVKDGNFILKDAKQNGIKSEFIVITAISDVPMVVECLKLGAYNYILKPPSKDIIIETVKSAYEHYKIKNSLEIFTTNKTISLSSPFKKIFTTDNNFKKILLYAERLANTDCPIIITGASGTGKTLLAGVIHDASSRNNKNFVSLNINAIPDTLFESSLFGYKKGSFTGAIKDEDGLLKSADGGTLFLDEIGSLSQDNQVKLLKVIEEKKFYPLGSTKIEKSNFRLITATNHNLEDEMKKGNFRKDLFYRINIGEIYLPDLKDRGKDVIFICKTILNNLNSINTHKKNFADDVFTFLLNYDFPGNYRELQNIIESAYYKTESDLIAKKDLSIISDFDNSPKLFSNLTLNEMKEFYIKKILKNSATRKEAAATLSISERQLYKYIKNF